MGWQQKNIGLTLPPEVQTTADNINTAISTVQPILDAATALLDLAKVFFLGGADPYAVIMSAIITELENLVNDLFGSGAFELIIDPFSGFPNIKIEENEFGHKQLRFKADKDNIQEITPGDAINMAIKSLDDAGDTNRPQFSDSAQVAGFGILVTAVDVNVFLTLLNALYSLWTIEDLQLMVRLVEEKRNPPTYSKKPDWGSLRFNQVKPLGDLQKELLKNLAIARGYILTADTIITELIDMLARKVQILNDSLTALQQVIDAIAGLSLANAYFLSIPLGVGGNNRIKQELASAELSALKLNKYTAMVLYIGGGPSAAGVETIRQMLE